MEPIILSYSLADCRMLIPKRANGTRKWNSSVRIRVGEFCQILILSQQKEKEEEEVHVARAVT